MSAVANRARGRPGIFLPAPEHSECVGFLGTLHPQPARPSAGSVRLTGFFQYGQKGSQLTNSYRAQFKMTLLGAGGLAQAA